SGAARCPTGLTEQRQMRHPRNHFAVRLQSDQYAPQQVAAHKVTGPVDGIDNPPPSAARRLARAFLTQDSILWKHLFDSRADQSLALAIRVRHRRFIS